jgi:hypothetical protein
MEDVVARLASAKAARSAAVVIVDITREKAALTQALKDITLSEEECCALPDKLRELDSRLYDFLVTLSEAEDCDLATMDKVAKMQEAVTAALNACSLGEPSGDKGIMFYVRGMKNLDYKKLASPVYRRYFRSLNPDPAFAPTSRCMGAWLLHRRHPYC